MRQGQVWQFERDRPSKEDDPRTPYGVVVSADYRLPPERRWVLTAPIVSTLDVDTPVAVRLQPDDPVKGFIRADKVNPHLYTVADRTGRNDRRGHARRARCGTPHRDGSLTLGEALSRGEQHA
ncbi:MAG: hypothetical protein ACRDSZ_01920, partial [Pseudonocardiaceae bacterium]